MSNHYLNHNFHKAQLLRSTLFFSLLSLFLFSFAQTDVSTTTQPSTLLSASIVDSCLTTLPSVQDTYYSELYQIDSQHAALVYQYTSDKVNQWLSFGDYLETAIHESNHHLNRVLSRECEPFNKRKYFLIGHVYETDLQVGETPSISIINQTVPASLQASERYSIYISANPNVRRNTLSSLLDELTTYTGEASIHLARKQNSSALQTLNYSQFQIDGMVNFMLYLQAYLKSARLYYPEAYAKIESQEKTLAYVATVWKQAEDILIASYPYIQNDRHLKSIYTSDMLMELDLIDVPHLNPEDYQNSYFSNE